MSYAEFYGKPRSNQLEISGLGSAAEQVVQEARQWKNDNAGAWNYMKENALRLNKSGYVSVNYLVNMVRNELHVKVKNGYAPSFARMMVEEEPRLKDAFRMCRSQSDGFVLWGGRQRKLRVSTTTST